MEVLLLFICFSTGEALSMMALVGDDVTLSYDTKLSTDISEETVEWSRTDLKPDIVHLHEKGRTFYKQQNPAYRGRTVLLAEDLERGIISLRLSHVRLHDAGNYTCVFASKHNQPPVKDTVQLLVGAASSPVITLEDINSSGLVLGCRAAGWYPPPQLSWWNAEGLRLPAVTMTTSQDPDHLYNINSTVVVVEKSLSFTCRVHQERFNQTRETERHLPKNLFSVQQSYRSIPWMWAVIGPLIIGVLLGVALEIGYGKLLGCSRREPDDQYDSVRKSAI